MATGANAYLVVRQDDDFGEVFPLIAGRQTLGRAATNRIVLKDEMCSREHAEVYHAAGEWHLRDLGSLNGSRVNGLPVREEYTLAPLDEVNVGRTTLVFVEDLAQLPNLPPNENGRGEETLEIKKRLGRTERFLEAAATATVVAEKPAGRKADRHALERDLSLLFRLALDMGSAATVIDLANVVLDGLFAGIPAEVGAILTVKESKELDLIAFRHRHPNAQTYHKVSQFVSQEVLARKEAILAENVAADRSLKNRESLGDLHVFSLICAPVIFEEQVLALVHLYRTSAASPLENDDLEFALAVARQFGAALHRLTREVSLSAENKVLRDQLKVESELISASPQLRTIEEQVARVAETQATVLIRGESGVGKELVARAVHYSSHRRTGPFVTLNCAALTETLLESELFGHEKGSFTGATEKMIGKFEQADGGTIFLDEIGEMSFGTQAKLLRVLEGQPFERVGGHVPIKVDVRVLAATNQPLEEFLRSGRFRRDLFFRLQVVEITVPPLRERKEDVPVLAEHFLKRFAREAGRKIKGLTAPAVDKLIAHPWPGNVRELRNAIERAVVLAPSGKTQLDAADIWLPLLGEPAEAATAPEYEAVSIDEIEKRHILATLQHTDWNKSRTAEILGIERSTLDRKIKGYGLTR